ncbi:efflux RND transporter periplasmic adaptor subunit [Caulobacter sp. RL271]|uniref:Efflux RND transporter periplasmic adaptor subunit n=1 Tax=Caulobacter segnis TaxID=88688 RepID=A0ABY4ZXM9_9CAUL|nr:efflux RND transporter periplasmic adaptor subunit [Caulobacter segnis]USQ96944.1 efflux RND transporter periplasmic adaptor subunit [Caulobacter segnis]
MRPAPMTTRYMIATALVCSAVGLTACGKKEDDKKAPAKTAAAAAAAQARTVSVGSVETRPLGGGVEASGLLVSREEAAVGSELTGYRVARLYADEGDWVRAGQPLAQLDDTLLRAQVDQQAAVTAQSQAEAARVSGLDGQGVLSQEQIETRRYQAKAQAAALKELRTRVSRMTITSPVSGRVLSRGVQPGQIAGGGTTPWFTIARDGLVELDAEVNEADLPGIRVGQSAQVSLPGGQSISGVVRLVSPRVDSNNRLGKVRVRLPVRDDLRPGGFGRANFGASSATVTAIPESAIRYEADGLSVMTVDSNNRAHQVAVKIGQKGGGWAQLVQGPPAGTRIVLGGASFVTDGDVVRPAPQAAR